LGEGLIAAICRRRWGQGAYSKRMIQRAVKWLAELELFHRHQPPPADHFLERGISDPIPSKNRGPSGNAYNEYWFSSDVVRGAYGRRAAQTGLQHMEDELRTWLLQIEAPEPVVDDDLVIDAEQQPNDLPAPEHVAAPDAPPGERLAAMLRAPPD